MAALNVLPVRNYTVNGCVPAMMHGCGTLSQRGYYDFIW
jgi:hypothetical protein